MVGETTKALQVQPAAGGSPIWLPKSVVLSPYRSHQKTAQPLLLEPWFMLKEVAEVRIGKTIKETDRAVCIRALEPESEHWVPKSAIYAVIGEPPDAQTFLLAKWFLKKDEN